MDEDQTILQTPLMDVAQDEQTINIQLKLVEGKNGSTTFLPLGSKLGGNNKKKEVNKSDSRVPIWMACGPLMLICTVQTTLITDTQMTRIIWLTFIPLYSQYSQISQLCLSIIILLCLIHIWCSILDAISSWCVCQELKADILSMIYIIKILV